MSFQQGLSGLNATSKNLEIIGNNIANANTFGSKVARAEFADVYAAALNGAGANAIGIGTTLAAVAQQFTQGNITTTENPMDLAINGAGFFQVTDGSNPTAVHPQRPVQGRPRRLHRQQRRHAPDGLPRRRAGHRSSPARRCRCSCPPAA